MAGISKIKELEARKRALVTESEIYRETLRADVQNLQLYGASFFRRIDQIRGIGPWLLMALPMAAPVVLGLLLELDLTLLGTGLAGLFVAIAMTPAFVRVKGPAEWKERLEPRLRDVPSSIRVKALLLKREVPQMRFFVGELFQQQTKLDPYLVAEYQGERLVLGIWDGEQVIISA